MSLATLKRKSNTTYKKLSGKNSGDRFIINKQTVGNPSFQIVGNCIKKMFQPQSTESVPNYNTITGQYGGFSINGKRRNIGRVGQNMRMSKGLSRMKSISSSGCKIVTHTLTSSSDDTGSTLSKKVCRKTKSKRYPVWKGAGGKIGKYGRGTQEIVDGSPPPPQAGSNGASGKYGIACCNGGSKLVHPSVLSFKGMMNARNRWVSLTVPPSIYNEQGIDNPPYNSNIIKATYNNWVQNLGGNGNIKNNTQGQYIIDKLKPSVQICNLPAKSDIPTAGQKLINTYNCKGCNVQIDSDENNLQAIKQRGQCNKCYSRIGGKYKPPTPFSKDVTLIPDSSNHTSIIKRRDAYEAKRGWKAIWPPTVTDGQCIKPDNSILDNDILKRKGVQNKLLEKSGIRNKLCSKEAKKRAGFIQFRKSCNNTLSLSQYIDKYKIQPSSL